MPLPHALKAALALAAVTAAAQPAHALLITFDELDWNEDAESYWEQPVENQYAAFGVTFNMGFLSQDFVPEPQDPPAHVNQYLLGGHEMTVTFSGTLPNYVSFNMGSPYREASESYVTALAADNSLVGRGRTGGYFPDGTQEPPFRQELPYVHNRYVTFYSPEGIRTLNFYDAYGSRFATTMDNLYFGAVPAVPEPATLGLWGAGLGVLAWARRRRAKTAPAG